jgi:hypothetical protein
MRALAVSPVVVMLFSVACAPMIAHGPEVRSGFSGGVSASLGRGPTYENGDDPGPFYFGAVAASAAYGIRPVSSSLPAVRFGIQGPTEYGVAIDAFAQLPRRWLGPVALGAGIIADGRRMPYLQAGIKNRDGLGLNVAIGRYSGRDRNTGYFIDERAQVNWLNLEAPLVSFATLHIHAGYATGHVKKQFDGMALPYRDEDRWVKLGGATLELHRPAAQTQQKKVP